MLVTEESVVEVPLVETKVNRGVASIKSEYLVVNPPTTDTPAAPVKIDDRDRDDRDQPHSKKSRKFKNRGQNKNRKVSHSVDKIQLCPAIGRDFECSHGENCKFTHDISTFLASKEPDIGTTCVNFELTGKCSYGYRCRFLAAHLNGEDLVVDEEVDIFRWKYRNYINPVKNILEGSYLQKIRKNELDLTRSNQVIAKLKEEIKAEADTETTNNQTPHTKDEPTIVEALPNVESNETALVETAEYIEVPETLREKKLIDFRHKTYLAPLTTVGNLPFRRICKGFGVDITCGEMAMSSNLLQGQKAEWSLVRRHQSETIFGIQIAGNHPESLSKVADILNQSVDVDFVDINLGCPIDVVYSRGGGSALLATPGKLGRIVRSVNEILDCPLTVKFRTGVYDKKPVAHKLVPQFASWGCNLGTLHGRSREQRYTKLANWEYIRECSSLKGNMSLFGNGDIMSYTDYYSRLENEQLDGIMIGRGALIKPWIFEEIQRKHHYDISSRERLDIIKQFCNFGLEYWGSDTMGVNNTRRFLLEWMSFLYRYIPVGILEVLPQGMNDRPPQFTCRDDLETKMASPSVNDWIEISEMFLGPVPEDFNFIPKHKANSFSQ